MSWRGGRRRVGGPRAGGGRASRRHPSWRRWALLAAAMALVGAGLWLSLGDLHPTRPPVVTPRRVEAPDGERGNVKAGAPGRARVQRRRSRAQQGNDASRPAGPPGQLALVIDDLGRSVDDVAALDRKSVV